ncbi:histidine kinase [Streptomyces sp. MST-110588]|uniref:sensor histidine kinase n=1 Tax=Streptomyces sp. MST-110588 TaxID=2833628 RepID=UPI001F5D234A|nr:histidine kinase [Streptomyces sp. MST-110588]UNO43079.1 hypothetical protein KGS77_30740 [Streptomyces sp. MST-110588]
MLHRAGAYRLPPTWRDLAVTVVLLYGVFTVFPAGTGLLGRQTALDDGSPVVGPVDVLLQLLVSAMALPVYMGLAARCRESRSPAWRRRCALLAGAGLLLLTAAVPVVGVAALCFLGGGVLRERRALGRPRPAAPPPAEPGLVTEARQEERSRLRRDLHDGLGPALAGIRLQLETAQARLQREPDARRLVAAAAAQTAQAVQEVHRVIDGLRPADLEEDELPGALRRLARRMRNTSVAIAVRTPERPARIAPVTEVAAYRIAAEAVTNAIRHADADRIEMRLTTGEETVVLDVIDDGVGLHPGSPRHYAVGVTSMARRAADVGGRCVVASRRGPSPGTVVHAELPRSPR